MDEYRQASASASPKVKDDFLEAPPIPEDWGGEGQSRMNLSGRCTAIAPKHTPRQHRFFDTHSVSEEPWLIRGLPEKTRTATRKLLSWHEKARPRQKFCCLLTLKFLRADSQRIWKSLC